MIRCDLKALKESLQNISHIIVSILMIFMLLFVSNRYATAAEINHRYDFLNRLTKTISIDGDKTTTIEYSYDDTGNMTNATTTVEGGLDIVTFAAQFGQTGCTDCETDLNDDGDVDGQDLIAFINR